MNAVRGEPRQPTRVLIISQDLVGTHMAGPGIRYWELSRVLSQTCQVTLAAPVGPDAPPVNWAIHALTLGNPAEIEPLLANAEVVVSSGFMLYNYPQLESLDTPWVIDAYIPSPSEGLAFYQHCDMAEQVATHAANRAILNRAFTRGDFILCGSERQRDLYLGILASLGRMNPYTYAQDATLRGLIDVVPFGLPSAPPVHSRSVFKGMQPGVSAQDKVILWGGGLWDWLDALTLVQAMSLVVQQRTDVRLYFPGPRHPFQERVPDMPMHARTVALSDSLGLTGRYVFFGDWMPSQERANYLLEADIGVALHFPGIEARYALRTRVLDYIWAGLPMVLSAGDVFADWVQERGLGVVVQPQDVEGVARALLQLLQEKDARAVRGARFADAAASLHWERAAAPLIAFCQHPTRAADRRAGYPPPDRAPAAQALIEPCAQPAADDSRQRIQELEGVVAAYERGRFMRAMAACKRWRERLTQRGQRP